MGKMWQRIARFILKQRIPILIVIVAATVFMGFNAQTNLSHQFLRIVPPNDPDLIAFNKFKGEFGEAGNVLVMGIRADDVFSKEYLNEIYALQQDLKTLNFVEGVVCVPNLQTIVKNKEEKKFDLQPLMAAPVQSQEEADSIRDFFLSLPFYQGRIVNDSLNFSAVAVTINEDTLNSSRKVAITDSILFRGEAVAERLGGTTHVSGIPYLRSYNQKHLPAEMRLFLILALVITAVVLFLFFRSWHAVLFPLLIIGIVIVWSLGVLGLLGYEISMMTAIIPSLITVIGIPNSVYLLTKYHFEYKRTGNKIKSLVLVIQKIGIVTVMTNATTAVGFLVLLFTDIQILREFGITAGISVIITFFISLLLIPIFFSYLPPPGRRETKHIETRYFSAVIAWLQKMVAKRRTIIYIISVGLVVLSAVGIGQLESVSYMSDDLPEEVRQDMHYLDESFGGVMPFEICINTHRNGGAFKRRNLKKLEKLQTTFDSIPELSQPISILNFVKYGRQAYFGGGEDQYSLPLKNELDQIQLYAAKGLPKESLGSVRLVDSTSSKIRISMNIQDVGSEEMARIADFLNQETDSTFLRHQKPEQLEHGAEYKVYGPEKGVKVKYGKKTLKTGDLFIADSTQTYEIVEGAPIIDYSDRILITGTTRIFIKGTSFLIGNLLQSLVIAFVIIAILMAALFGNLRMVLASLVPNFLPLLFTAGVMGYLGIHLKPSTAMIFSVAFGIAVDDSIHYLARYRLARKTGDNVELAVSNSFKDTGLSMIYTSIILFFGFVIFAWSSFSTRVLGQLTSPTLLIALFSNLLLLPALLITLNPSSRPLKGQGIIDIEKEGEGEEIGEDFLTEAENENQGNGNASE